MKRKAQGHVEMIITTIFFLGFVVFIIFFMNPLSATKEDLPIVNIKDGFIQEASKQVGILSVVNDKTGCYDLTQINQVYGSNFIEVPDPSNTDPLKTKEEYIIYYGDFLNPAQVGVISCLGRTGPDVSSFAGYIEESIVNYEKVQELKTLYESDYSGLKDQLGVGDFEFKFLTLNEIEIEALSVNGLVPQSTDILSQQIPLRVINKDAKINEYILRIRVW